MNFTCSLGNFRSLKRLTTIRSSNIKKMEDFRCELEAIKSALNLTVSSFLLYFGSELIAPITLALVVYIDLFFSFLFSSQHYLYCVQYIYPFIHPFHYCTGSYSYVPSQQPIDRCLLAHNTECTQTGIHCYITFLYKEKICYFYVKFFDPTTNRICLSIYDYYLFVVVLTIHT